MKKLLFLLLLSLSSISAYTQYWGPDTLQTIDTLSFDSAINHLYGNLESVVPTGYLTNRSPFEVKEAENFDGSNYDSIGNYYLFLGLHSFMRVSNMNGLKGANMLELDSLINIHTSDSISKIPIGFQFFDYNSIDSLAIDSNALCWTGYRLGLCDSSFPSLFDTSTLFFASPLITETEDSASNFFIDTSFFFSNRPDTLDSILISIDGSPWVNYQFGDSFTVVWTDSGSMEFKIRIVNTSNDVFVARSYFRNTFPFEEERIGAPYRPKKSTAYCGSSTTVTIGDWLKVSIQPDKHYDMYATEVITNPDNKGSVKAKIGEYYACGNTSGKVRKPFIIVTGFSPDWGIFGQHVVPGANLTTTIANHNIYNNLNGVLKEDINPPDEVVGANNQANILYALRNEGFDIVIVDFYNGVDFVENGASLVTKLIKSINVTKEQNGYMHENVVMGVSLGALMTRYALAKMEADHASNPTANPHHHTRLSISYEGEMQGAHIPLAIQFGSEYLTKYIAPSIALAVFASAGGIGLAAAAYSIVKLRKLADQTINCPTAFQLLVEHHKANNQIGNDNTLYKHSAHTAFFSALNTLGYPSIRNIAIANADQDGDGVSSSIAQEASQIFNINTYTQINGTLKGFLEKSNSTQTLFQAGFNLYTIRILGAYRTIRKQYTKTPSLACASTERFYDPGTFQLNRPILTHSSSKRLDNYNCTFVPITSVFDIQTSTNKYYGYDAETNLRWYEPGLNSESWGYPHNSPNLTQPQTVTPFDAIFVEGGNDLHVNDPRWQIREFLIDEMADNSTYKYFLENRSIGVSEAYEAKFEARQELTIGKAESREHVDGRFILGEFSETEITSEKEVVCKPGFDIVAGAKTVIKIENMCSQCFAFQSLNRTGNELNPSVVSEPYVPANDRPNFIEEILDPKNPEVMIYPNPTLSSINIKNVLIGSKYDIKDAFGKRIKEGIIQESEYFVGLDELKSGIYFIHLKDQMGEVHTKRIVKL